MFEQIVGEQMRFKGESASTREIAVLQSGAGTGQVVANLTDGILLTLVKIAFGELLEVSFRRAEKLLGELAVAKSLLWRHARRKLSAGLAGAAVADHSSPLSWLGGTLRLVFRT